MVHLSDGGSVYHAMSDCAALVTWQDQVRDRGGKEESSDASRYSRPKTTVDVDPATRVGREVASAQCLARCNVSAHRPVEAAVRDEVPTLSLAQMELMPCTNRSLSIFDGMSVMPSTGSARQP
jgi:hypothetical protein